MTNRGLVFRADGSRELGLGHIMRCMTLADAVLKKSAEIDLDLSIHFVSKDFEGARNAFSNSPFSNKVLWLAPDADENAEFKKFLNNLKPKVVITDIDLRDKLDDYLKTIYPIVHISLHEHNFPILAGDRVIAPTIRPLQHHTNTMPGYSSFTGADYVILPLEILDLRKIAPAPALKVTSVTITMGGGDPERLTEPILNAIRACNNPGIEWRVVLGPASGYDKWEFEGKFPAIIKYFDGKDLPRSEFLKLLSESDLVITNAGTSVYEALALGRPVMAVPQNDFEKVVAGILKDADAVVTPESNTSVEILNSLASIVDDHIERQRIAKAGSELIDGRGSVRIADIILEKIT